MWADALKPIFAELLGPRRRWITLRRLRAILRRDGKGAERGVFAPNRLTSPKAVSGQCPDCRLYGSWATLLYTTPLRVLC